MTNPSLSSSSGSIMEASLPAPATQEPALKPGDYPFKRGQLRAPSCFFSVFFYICMMFSSPLNCSFHCSSRPQDPQSKPEEKRELPSTCRYSKETSIGFTPLNVYLFYFCNMPTCHLPSLVFYTQKSYFPQNQS